MFFSYNGINCADKGVTNVNISSGLQEDPFLPTKNILEQKIKGNPKPYFMGVEYEPLEIPITLSFDEEVDENKLREIANWIDIENYAPLIFEEKQTHIYYAMTTEEGLFVHNGCNQGYVTFTFRCDSPWAYTPSYSQEYDFTTNTVLGTSYTIINHSDFKVKPLIELEVIEGTSFSIVNMSNQGEKLELTGLVEGEKLIIDCEYKSIETDIPLTYRYGNRTNDSKFISFVKGYNYLKVYGKVKLTFIYRGYLKA